MLPLHKRCRLLLRSGNGVVNYSVAANTGPQRSGTITIAGQTFTVNQAAGCAYSLSTNSLSAAATASTSSVNVTAGTGCAWTGVSNVNWLTVTAGASGTGNGMVNFSIAANTGPARSGTLTVAETRQAGYDFVSGTCVVTPWVVRSPTRPSRSAPPSARSSVVGETAARILESRRDTRPVQLRSIYAGYLLVLLASVALPLSGAYATLTLCGLLLIARLRLAASETVHGDVARRAGHPEDEDADEQTRKSEDDDAIPGGRLVHAE